MYLFSDKSCPRCKRFLSSDSFYPRGGGKSLHSHCKECMKKSPKPNKNISTKIRRQKKAEFILSQKIGRSCSYCKNEFHPWQMDFDHVDVSNKFDSISALVNQDISLERLSKELSKCQLVCVGCHRTRTFKETQHIWLETIGSSYSNPRFALEPKLVVDQPSKLCKGCGELRNLDQFPKTGKWFRHKCIVCKRKELSRTRFKYRNKYNNTRRLKRSNVRDFVDKYKMNPCTDCGNKYDPRLMDFDHINEKVSSISKAVLSDWGESKVLAEINKCELVCCWCHRTRTYRRLIELGKAYNFGIYPLSGSHESRVLNASA